MNVIYVPKDKLPIYNVTGINKEDFSRFFSSHKRSVIYVIDDSDNLIGYIDHDSYKLMNDSIRQIIPFEFVINIQDISTLNIRTQLSETTKANTIPVMDKGCFVGALVKNYSEELVAFDRLMNQVALSVLACFKKEVTAYLYYNSIQSISFIGEEEEYNYFKDVIGDAFLILPFGDTTGQLKIDVEHSKSYRNKGESTKKQTLSLEELMTLSLIPCIKKYVEDNSLHLHFFEGPIADKLLNYASHCSTEGPHISFAEAIASESICDKFSARNTTVKNFLMDRYSGPFNDNSVISNGVNLLMADTNRGKDLPNCNAIYFYGSCLTYGVCVPDEFSIPSITRTKIKGTGYDTVNNGVKNGHSLLNDFLFILNTPFRHNDHIIIINAFSEQIRDSLNSAYSIVELSKTLNQNDDKPWFFLDNTFHVNHIANGIIANLIVDSLNLNKNQPIQSHKKSLSFFDNCNRRSCIDSSRLIEKGLLGSYREYLLSNKRETTYKAKIGAVLLTANPITKGHERLISYAKRHCDLLYLFIVEEDLFFFSTAERMMLTRSVISDPDIIIVSTGNLMTAEFTFPEYFSKDKNHIISQEDIPDFHCNIFGGFVCPLLGITKRFVAEEIEGSVTDRYNEKLLSVLPKYGVDVEVIPRFKTNNNTVISSSIVRSLIENKEWDNLSLFVSKPIKEYIEAKWKMRD